ncbi:hypothetical protein GCM10023083_19530 [Streptomyces phyllanthi]
MTLRATVAGASGCAGGEILRLPLSHPEVETGAVTAHVSTTAAHLRGNSAHSSRTGREQT